MPRSKMNPNMKMRHRARVLALQALFELDLTHHQREDVIAGRLEQSQLSPDAIDLFYHLLDGVLWEREQIDQFIQELAPERPIEQLAVIDRNILRLAIWEIISPDASTPYRVVINEAVELAKTFGAEHTSRFVNGVLGSMVTRHKDRIASLRRVGHEQHT